MEFVIGPVLALLLGMKFTDYKCKEAAKKAEATLVENNTQISQQTLKLLMPMAKSVTAINNQLGL